MNFYDYTQAKINIGMALMGKGWNLYDFKFGESDAMTDYFENDTWSGIASKNGYILVVRNQYKSKFDNKLLPDYQINPKGSTWHIEKDGQIVAKGGGLNKVSSYKYRKWDDKDIEKIKHYEENGYLMEDLRQFYFRLCRYDNQYQTLEDFLSSRDGQNQKESYLRHNEEDLKFLTELESLINKFEMVVSGDAVVADKQQSQPQSKIKILSWEIQESIHTITKEKLYVAKQKTTLNKDEYLKVLFQVKNLGGYYSKFVSGFVFKTNPEEELEQITL